MAHMIRRGLRGLTAAFIALVACLAIAPTAAFAAEWTDTNWSNGSITVDSLESGETATLYQLATVELDADTNTTSLVAVNSNDDFQSALESYVTSPSATTAANLVALVTELNISASDSITVETSGTVTFTDLKAGVYYVAISGNADYTYQPVIVSISPEADGANGWKIDSAVSAYPKKASSSVNKFFVVDDNLVDTVNGEVGKKYDFQIDFEIAANSTEFKVIDEMDGFTFVDDSLIVKVGDNTLTAGMEYTLNVDNDSKGFTIEFAESYLNSIESGSVNVVVTYSATLENVTSAKDGAKNTVTTTTDSAGDTVTAEFGKVGVLKWTGDSETPTYLSGAVFQLFDSEGNEVTDVGNNSVYLTTDESGWQWTSEDVILEIGETYKLVETQAPSGYTIDDDNNSYTVVACAFDTESGDGYNAAYAAVYNEAAGATEGIGLPTTGGTGTVIMTAAGVVLIAGAAVMIARSRKQD